MKAISSGLIVNPDFASVQLSVLSFTNKQPEEGSNYVAAIVTDSNQQQESVQWHAGIRVLALALDWIKSNGVPSTIHMYTYHYPHPVIARDIGALADLYPNTSIFVGYSQQLNDQDKQIESLQTLFRVKNLSMDAINVRCINPCGRFRRRISNSNSCSSVLTKEGSCRMPSEKSLHVYLADPATFKFIAVTPPCVRYYNTPCMGAEQQTASTESKMQLFLLDDGKVALKASNGKYLSRIAYSNDATDNLNRIQPVKSSIDRSSRFSVEYTEDSNSFDGVGTIALKSNNGRYVAPHGGSTIKPLATTPYRFIFYFARS